ncbi:putative U3 small nucleolar RNA-associated protein 18 [Hirsutella rhossiliensis]|uniref:U3 small nucleolar RNA-associated protein 18 n=1 Tax=Hirsutella rhossiliensis TaxID=111463 RepID=A0A9P8MYA1_9HYPO|nr:putative U3 small nucleolar RNA-associated protein 18 [Hirsutella rhossiliensis]KAH0963429.1 putative U3 small nucleolar RNA-associated protein 18 [Hirsutella rhossiliensis]
MAPQAEQWESDSDSQNASDTGSHDVAASPEAAAGLFDKDSDEEELEQLVLGNKTSFRESLFKYGHLFDDLGADGGELEAAGADTGGLEDVDDGDLFMFDTGVAGAARGVAKDVPGSGKTAQDDAPAWEDSDDDRLTVSLASVTRLRKLRITEAEDVVSGTEYCTRLRQQYQRLYPAPAWAQQSDDRPTKRRRRSSAASDSSSDDDSVSAQPLEAFLRDVNRLAGLGGPTRRGLRPEVLNIQRTREILDTHKLPVACLSFHPEYPVLLSASAASVLFLHHIAPDAQPPNPRLTSVQVKQVDVRAAEFLYPRGDKIFFAGRRKFFHHWDLPSGVVQKTTQVLGHRLEHKSMERFKLSPCGRYMAIVASTRKGGGVVNVLSVASMQWVAAARLQSQNGLADFAWWSTGNGMTILGKDGMVGEYSMERQSFIAVWHDDGNVGGIVLALGGHGGPAALGEDRWVAVGSNSGITNIYERQDLVVPGEAELTIKERPTPRRVLDHLVTPITVLAFSPDGQLLAFGSRAKKDALRLVHLPSCTVYRNWPTQQTPLGRITTVAFGRGSDLLAVGNDIGKIRLWTIQN